MGETANILKEEQMFGAEQVRQKVKTEVELLLSDGTELSGHLFVDPQDRLLETLNDTRTFLPIKGNDGGVILINKSTIHRIKLMDQEIKLREVTLTHIGQ